MYQELIEGGKDHVILFLATEALDLLITEWEKGEEKAGESLKIYGREWGGPLNTSTENEGTGRV